MNGTDSAIICLFRHHKTRTIIANAKMERFFGRKFASYSMKQLNLLALLVCALNNSLNIHSKCLTNILTQPNS